MRELYEPSASLISSKEENTQLDFCHEISKLLMPDSSGGE